MTGPEKLFALCHAVRHVVAQNLPGAIVECGVWRGGSMMAVARTLLELDAGTRERFLFDTYEGMPEPTEQDVDLNGVSRQERWNSQKRNRLTMRGAGVAERSPRGHAQRGVRPVAGAFRQRDVEDTIPGQAPEEIALLRLDTDYYASTRQEMFELYPRLTRGGVLIIDDYGHFRGSEQAVTEFIEAAAEPILLHRVDYSARAGVKP